MVQSPSWEGNWFAASQEIPHISRNPKVHYRTHKRPPPVSILGQTNPVHIPTSQHLEIHPNIIHPPTPRSPQCSLSLRFPHQDPIHTPSGNFGNFVQPDSSLQYLHHPLYFPYTKPDESTPAHPSYYFNFNSILNLPATWDFLSFLFNSGFPINIFWTILLSPIHVTRPVSFSLLA